MKKVTLFLVLAIAYCLTVKASTDPLQQYVAKYKFPEGSVITEVNIILDNGALSATSSIGCTSLQKNDEDHFAITSYNGHATFTRNDAKKITGIKIEVMGLTLEGTREENTIPSDGKIILPMKFPLPMMPQDG